MQRRMFCRSMLATAATVAAPVHQVLAAANAVADSGAAPLRAVTGDGAQIELARSSINEFGSRIAGRLLTADSAGYDAARRVINPAIDKHPALIVQCTGAADVHHAVTFARAHELLVAVKCGGHSFAGKSTCNDGLVIDLSLLRGVQVDPEARTARVAGGSLLGQLDHETMAFGLVTTAGTVSHTGVGGLTLGGGFGRLARRFGLALDNVNGLELITADGQFRRANANENPDLYWGLRGGGGNFGVVTGFDFQLHPMQRQVVGGDMLFPIERARELLSFYAEYSASAPDDLYTDFVMLAPPGGADGVVLIHVCYSGPSERAPAVLEPLYKLGKPIADSIHATDYVALQSSWDDTDPRTMGEYLKSGFTTDITPSMIDAIIDGFEPHPNRQTVVFFQQSGGAVSRVPAGATAFAHRYAQHSMFATVSWPQPDHRETQVQWLKKYWATLAPFTNGFYTNEVGNQSQSVVNANYKGNYEQLARLKKQYDPDNLFRLNANVQPAT